MPDPGARGVPSIQPPNYVSIPLWMPLVVTGVFTARSWRSHRARTTAADRARTGACPRCGYAREGLAPAAPCPECALVPPPSPLPTAPPVSPPEPS